MKEEWRPVVGNDSYMVSSYGRVYSHITQKYLSTKALTNGYPCLNLGWKNRKRLHILVAEAFLGPCPLGHEVRHKDGKRGNPRLDNLRYGTRKQNIQDSVAHGTHSGFNKAARAKGVATKDRKYPGWRNEAFSGVKYSDI